MAPYNKIGLLKEESKQHEEQFASSSTNKEKKNIENNSTIFAQMK